MIHQISEEEFRNNVFDVVGPHASKFTTPIAHIKNGKEIDYRSAVLLKIGNLHFIVTAAHDMPEHIRDGVITCIVMPRKENSLVPILAEEWWTTKDPKEDLAVAQLLPETVTALGEHYSYLRMTDLMSKNALKGPLYLVFGFPYQMISPDEDNRNRTDSWQYITHPHEQLSNVENYDPKLQLILKYERQTYHTDGRIVHPPAMSGCGIWTLGTNPFQPNIDNVKLVAIQCAWHKGHEYIKCSWIDNVCIIIWKYFPAVRDAMRLHGFEHHDGIHLFDASK